MRYYIDKLCTCESLPPITCLLVYSTNYVKLMLFYRVCIPSAYCVSLLFICQKLAHTRFCLSIFHTCEILPQCEIVQCNLFLLLAFAWASCYYCRCLDDCVFLLHIVSACCLFANNCTYDVLPINPTHMRGIAAM